MTGSLEPKVKVIKPPSAPLKGGVFNPNFR